MSSFTRLPYILEKTPLDRETKLQIIDVLLVTKDQAQIDELMKKLIEWKLADDAATEQFIEQIKALKQAYDQEIETIENKSQRKTLEVADMITKENKIQAIRKRIL